MRQRADHLFGENLAEHVVIVGAASREVNGMTAIVGAQLVERTPGPMTGRGPGGPMR